MVRMMNFSFFDNFGRNFVNSKGDKAISLIAACSSDKGIRRQNNEDNFYFDGKVLSVESLGTNTCYQLNKSLSGYTLFGVFDGMGGGEYGEVASYEAACSADDFMHSDSINNADITPSLTTMCLEMNRRVFEQGYNLGAYQMGSTLVVLFFYSGQVWVCNLGDSKAFILRDGMLTQLSHDHTDADYLKEQGITNRKPYLTQYLGVDPEETRIEPYIKSSRYAKGDRYLLCSDGLTDMVSEDLIAHILRNSPNAGQAVTELIAKALENGGKDNITVIVCDIL